MNEQMIRKKKYENISIVSNAFLGFTILLCNNIFIFNSS